MPKLLEQVRTVIRTRHDGQGTEQACIHWIKKNSVFTTMINTHVLNRRGRGVRSPLDQQQSGGRPPPRSGWKKVARGERAARRPW